ncbi:MAG TPA: type II toxin-antitoxin system VapB family antitoxin [Cytophagales bacterium]|nr:type II toxin-antitoxin system VapB family antitoxin [Cytophagales bacterium]
MRTNIDLDDDLIAKAMEISNTKTKKEVVHKALEEFVRRHAQLNIAKMRGKVIFWPGYNE